MTQCFRPLSGSCSSNDRKQKRKGSKDNGVSVPFRGYVVVICYGDTRGIMGTVSVPFRGYVVVIRICITIMVDILFPSPFGVM